MYPLLFHLPLPSLFLSLSLSFLLGLDTGLQCYLVRDNLMNHKDTDCNNHANQQLKKEGGTCTCTHNMYIYLYVIGYTCTCM